MRLRSETQSRGSEISFPRTVVDDRHLTADWFVKRLFQIVQVGNETVVNQRLQTRSEINRLLRSGSYVEDENEREAQSVDEHVCSAFSAAEPKTGGKPHYSDQNEYSWALCSDNRKLTVLSLTLSRSPDFQRSAARG